MKQGGAWFISGDKTVPAQHNAHNDNKLTLMETHKHTYSGEIKCIYVFFYIHPHSVHSMSFSQEGSRNSFIPNPYQSHSFYEFTLCFSCYCFIYISVAVRINALFNMFLYLLIHGASLSSLIELNVLPFVSWFGIHVKVEGGGRALVRVQFLIAENKTILITFHDVLFYKHQFHRI